MDVKYKLYKGDIWHYNLHQGTICNCIRRKQPSIVTEEDYLTDCPYHGIGCPYDSSHRVLASKFELHLTKCRMKYPHAIKVQCPYNSTHFINEQELEHHCKECPDKIIEEPFLRETGHYAPLQFLEKKNDVSKAECNCSITKSKIPQSRTRAVSFPDIWESLPHHFIIPKDRTSSTAEVFVEEERGKNPKNDLNHKYVLFQRPSGENKSAYQEDINGIISSLAAMRVSMCQPNDQEKP